MPEERLREAALDRYWDDVVGGHATTADDPAPHLAETIRRFQSFAAAPAPAPVRERVRQALSTAAEGYARQTIAEIYDQLSIEEQRLFRRLSVFVGGWTLAVAQSATRHPVRSLPNELASLVEKRLVRATVGSDGETHFEMENAAREFGIKQLLAHGEMDELRAMYAAYSQETGTRPPTSRVNRELIPREIQILSLIVDGLTDKEIAATLGINTRTVTTYVTRIIDKFGVSNRAAAASYAIRHGLVAVVGRKP